MARKSKLTNQQWQEIAQLRANGSTYKQLTEKFGITRKAISDYFSKQDTAFDVVNQAATVLADQSPNITNATDYNDATKKEVNHFIQKQTTMINKIVHLQDLGIDVCTAILEFMKQGLATNKIAFSDLGDFTKFSESLMKQISMVSKLYGMGTPQSQVNVQMNQNNFNSRGQRIYPDDEFTGDEDIEIIFCTSNEQAKILKSQECSGCSNLLDVQ